MNRGWYAIKPNQTKPNKTQSVENKLRPGQKRLISKKWKIKLLEMLRRILIKRQKTLPEMDRQQVWMY